MYKIRCHMAISMAVYFFVFIFTASSQSEEQVSATTIPADERVVTNNAQRISEIEKELVEVQTQMKAAREELFKYKTAVDRRKRAILLENESCNQLHQEIESLKKQLVEKELKLSEQLKADKEYNQRSQDAEAKQIEVYKKLETSQQLLKEKRQLEFGSAVQPIEQEQ